mgnify:CR=1 FL=1
MVAAGKCPERGGRQAGEADLGTEVEPKQKAGLEIDKDHIVGSDSLSNRIHGLSHVASALVFAAHIRAMGRAEQMTNCNGQNGNPDGRRQPPAAPLVDRQADTPKLTRFY